MLGAPLPFPLVLAPTGYTRIADPQGELAVARAAQRSGVPYTLSTMSTRSIEEVAAAGGTGRRWFQVYVWRDRALVRDMVERAAAAGYEALVITVDTANLGRRERDVRRGFTLPPKLGLETILDGITHPGWTWRFARSEPILFANVATSKVGGNQYDGSRPIGLAEKVSSQFDPALSWADIEWFRSMWNGPIVLKGVQSVADARLAVEHGIDAIALSNHGGRQLDSAPAILELVAPVAQEVGGSIEIICDGGVRRGSDMVKALALGADACMVGRAYLYGLGAAGEARCRSGARVAARRITSDDGADRGNDDRRHRLRARPSPARLIAAAACSRGRRVVAGPGPLVDHHVPARDRRLQRIVDPAELPGDVGRGVVAQREHGVDRLVRRIAAGLVHPAHPLLVGLGRRTGGERPIADVGPHVGLDVAGVEHVRRDAGAGQLGGEVAGELVERHLGRAVGAVQRRRAGAATPPR